MIIIEHSERSCFYRIAREQKGFTFFVLKTQKWRTDPGIYFLKAFIHGPHNLGYLNETEVIRRWVKNGLYRGTMLRMSFKKIADFEEFLKQLSADSVTAEIQIMLNCLIDG